MMKVTLFLVLIPAVAACGGESTASSWGSADGPATTEDLEPAHSDGLMVGEVPGFGDGLHLVDEEIAPGVYRNTEPLSGCYWERLSGLSGDLDDIIASENAAGSVIIEILPTDAGFRASGCGEWWMGGFPATDSLTSFGEGTFIVGTDFEPGQYANTGVGSCYWERLDSFQHTCESIIDSQSVDGPTVVDILPTDVGFSSRDCGTWEKLD